MHRATSGVGRFTLPAIAQRRCPIDLLGIARYHPLRHGVRPRDSLLKRPKIRPVYYCLTFLWMALALAVFAWGLQYKLSLYHLDQAVSQKMPEAKLLSKDEQPNVVRAELTTAAPPAPESLRSVWPVWQLALLSLCGPLLLTLPFPGSRAGARLHRSLRPPELPAFFFRPPPVLY